MSSQANILSSVGFFVLYKMILTVPIVRIETKIRISKINVPSMKVKARIIKKQNLFKNSNDYKPKWTKV